MNGSLQTLFKDAQPRVVVLTGAGISAESGVPVFRGPDGLWHGRRVEDVATHGALVRDFIGVSAFFNELRRFVAEVNPNPAHKALAKLEAAYADNLLLVTQNIDSLHQKAGSQNLLPMHGQLQSLYCTACGAHFPFFGDAHYETPCPQCGQKGQVRPDIVLFEEMPYHMDQIYTALMQCDLFIAVGTSGVVYPAAGFVDLAARCGAYRIEVNLSETEASPLFNERREGPAGEVLPQLVEELLAL